MRKLILGLMMGFCTPATTSWAIDAGCISNGPGINGWTTTVTDDHYNTTTNLSYCDELGRVVGRACAGNSFVLTQVACPNGFRCERASFTGLGRCVQSTALRPTCTNVGTVGSMSGWAVQRNDASGYTSTVLSRCSDDGSKIIGYSCAGTGWGIQEVSVICAHGTYCRTNSQTGGGCVSGTPAKLECVSQRPMDSGWSWRVTDANKKTNVYHAQCDETGASLSGSTCQEGRLVPAQIRCPSGSTCSSGQCSEIPAPSQLALSITNYTAPMIQKDANTGVNSLVMIDGTKLTSCLNAAGYAPQMRDVGSGGFFRSIMIVPSRSTPASTYQSCMHSSIIEKEHEWYFWKDGKIMGRYFGCTTDYADKDSAGRPIPWRATKTAQIYFSGRQYGTDWTYSSGGISYPWYYAANDGSVNGVANGFTTTVNVAPINGYTMLSDTQKWSATKTIPVYVSGKRLGTDWQNCTTQ